MEQIYEIIKKFNRSDFRRKSIPAELVSGWPCLRRIGRTLCLTVPYFNRQYLKEEKKVALFPLYCSVTFPLGNPDRIVDFTIYANSREWQDLDYSRPVGFFKHEALADVKTGEDYKRLCQELYHYYDAMAEAIMQKAPFANEEEMIRLFTKLMEPGHFPQYLRINKRFYSYFCHL